MRTMMVALASAAVLATGCGLATTVGDATAGDPGGGVGSSGSSDSSAPAMGMCAPDAPDCVDTVVDGGDGGGDEMDAEVAREEAQALLGVAEADLSPDVRVARRGDEQMMLTEDYVINRFTVELDDDGSGTFVVTAVTVELEGGPETFTA